MGEAYLQGVALMSHLILASASPRRRELLALAGYTFEVHAAHIDETRHADEDPAAYVARLALEKAHAVHAQHPGATVLGADTTVVLNGEVLNKPQGIEEAARMLRALSGRTHQVHTGIAVVSSNAQRTHVETTNVIFRAISEEELAAYLATGDSLDKAGAYGIQGYAARWMPRIEGDYFNVMGLPVAATVQLLAM
jgi:septum formation protein